MTLPIHATGRFLAEYSRRPINVALLFLVPVIFVVLASGVITDFAQIVGTVADSRRLAAPTAGWAAAFLAGVAGLFLVLGSRDADRRLAIAGMRPSLITGARLGSGLALAVVAAAASIGALALGAGVTNAAQTVAGTLMFAFTYLGIGVAVGALVQSDVNGSLIVVFIWMIDVFLGPAMAGSDIWITRLFPSHYATLVMLDTTSGHSGPIGDLGWALMWTVIALAAAAAVFGAATSKRGGRPTAIRLKNGPRRVGAGLRYGLRDYRRNAALWVLLVLLPVFFISLSFYITPNAPALVELVEDGVATMKTLSMIDVHGAIMVPITVAFLAGLSGLFIVQGSLDADARLVVSGFRPIEILASRMGTIAAAVLLTTTVSLAVTAIDFTPEIWTWFSIGNLLVAATYGMIGVLVGTQFGRLGGLYVMFLLPFIDVGIAQNIMFSATPPAWGLILPSHGGVQVLVDAAFTGTFDQFNALALATAWLVAATTLAAIVFRHIARSRAA